MKWRDGQVSGVARHVGRCKAGRVTTYHNAREVNMMGGSVNLVLLLVVW